MNTSKMFTLNWKDLAKGVVMAVLTGAFLPISIAIQTPGFNIASANWQQLGIFALNGAVVGFIGYLVKNFFSNSQGQVLGSIG